MLFSNSNARNQTVVQALSAQFAPPTQERPYRIDTDQKISRPYVARASVAPSAEHPNGSNAYAQRYQKYVGRRCPWVQLSHRLIIPPAEVSNAAALHLLGQG